MPDVRIESFLSIEKSFIATILRGFIAGSLADVLRHSTQRDHTQRIGAALDRFAQFFTAPLFDVSYVDREKNAVDSEYQMGIKGDSRRNFDVFRGSFSITNLPQLIK